MTSNTVRVAVPKEGTNYLAFTDPNQAPESFKGFVKFLSETYLADTTSSGVLPSPQSTNYEPIGGGINPTGLVKKLNHNASERDRRKKINNLYSSLFSLLSDSNRMKKLSIPAIVARVVKYIPELQKEAETLVQKKE
ncbi:hypothetical protein AgCh_036648 [Apium graveolens]